LAFFPLAGVAALTVLLGTLLLVYAGVAAALNNRPGEPPRMAFKKLLETGSVSRQEAAEEGGVSGF
jgi:hypothetical protein